MLVLLQLQTQPGRESSGPAAGQGPGTAPRQVYGEPAERCGLAAGPGGRKRNPCGGRVRTPRCSGARKVFPHERVAGSQLGLAAGAGGFPSLPLSLPLPGDTEHSRTGPREQELLPRGLAPSQRPASGTGRDVASCVSGGPASCQPRGLWPGGLFPPPSLLATLPLRQLVAQLLLFGVLSAPLAPGAVQTQLSLCVRRAPLSKSTLRASGGVICSQSTCRCVLVRVLCSSGGVPQCRTWHDPAIGLEPAWPVHQPSWRWS